MFNIEEVLSKYNITEEEYNHLLEDCAEKINGSNEMDWSEISEKYHLGFAGDTLRKAQQVPLLGGAFVRDYYLKKFAENNTDNEEYSTTLSNQLRKLEREKIKFRDERNAWSKQNYSDARVEHKLDYLEEVLKNFGKINFKNSDIVSRNNDNEMIICLSDLHIGQFFNNAFGSYNSDIAIERLYKYLTHIKEYAEMYKVSKAKIILLGDLVSGNIHLSVQVTNRENVIEQIKLASQIIASFCAECCEIFESVELYSVSGNHSRIQKKDDAIHDERLDDLIGWIIGCSLSHINNFVYKNNNIDTGIATFEIFGKTYAIVHGDFDPANKNGVANLSLMLNTIPYAIFRGHNHYPSYDSANGVKIIQSGSLAGSGDQHTVEMRLTGKPSQTICICDKNGIKTHIPVEF